MRLATIGALKDLQIQTASDLESVKMSIGSGSIDSMSDGSINEEEIGAIEKEFGDLTNLDANQAWAELPPELQGIENKSFTDYSPDEAKKMLLFFQTYYGRYKAAYTNPLDLGISYASTYTDTTVNMAQEILIDKIYGSGTTKNGFSGENIIGFSGDE